ncbi:MAG TPA: pyruvate kinase [Pseudomonadales bacterium]|nr:pyruvate kinase [Pseudomonadales bacterium]HND14414.1 pyruvate kinase [Pseudomonadales bacterium]
MSVHRRTKIVATLGPASSSEQTIAALVTAGVDVFRLNFSHGRIEEHRARARLVRELSERAGREVALLGDLQGPKIRIRCFRDGAVELAEGAAFTLDCDLSDQDGDLHAVGVDLPTLPESVGPGDVLLLDDGRIRLVVDAVRGRRVECTVRMGGRLSDRKGLNRLGGGLSAPALTDRDRDDIAHAAELGLDYLAVSFPLSAADIECARSLAEAAGCHARIIAKIERAEVVHDEAVLDAMIVAADGIMVARGDLGVEVGDAELIGIQKQLIRKARRADRVVITATQMMESMVYNPIPTRAEVFDVANAVLDGTDAVMLSAESASGRHPVEAVTAMATTCLGAETYPDVRRSSYRVDRAFTRIDEAIAMAAVYAANHLERVVGMVCLTESGTTALRMSRLGSGLPIYALSRHPEVIRRMCLYRGVRPLLFDYTASASGEIARDAVHVLERHGLVTRGERLIVTHGDLMGVGGSTTTLKILEP